ncbi:MAG: sensor histidine kinase [Bacilli bacterium]
MKNISRFFPQSLRFQLLSRALVLFAALLLLMGAIQYLVMRQFMYHYTASTLSRQIRTMSQQTWAGLVQDPRSKDSVQSLSQFLQPDTSLVLISSAGQVIWRYTGPGPKGANRIPELSSLTYENMLMPGPHPDEFFITTVASGQSDLVVLHRLGPPGGPIGIVQMDTSLRPIHDILRRTLWTYLLGASVTLVIGVATYLPLLRKTLSPLSKMIAILEQTDVDNLGERLSDTSGPSEVRRLARSYNEMLVRIRTSFTAEQTLRERMRQFLADASHELRTPLTSIHGFIEVLRRGAASHPGQLDMALSSMQSESERLARLVNDLLTLTKLDQSATVTLKRVDLSDLILCMEPQLRILAGARSLDIEAGTGLSTMVDPDKLQQVILNLFQNAVQFTNPEHGRIRLLLTAESDSLRLSVEDNGLGIPDDQLDRVFERFYRVEGSRNRHHGGSGLGLSIVKAIVDMHHGTVTVLSQAGHGTTFQIELPAPYAPSRL